MQVDPFLSHPSKYVRDAAANVMRNASRYNPDYVKVTVLKWREKYKDDKVALKTLEEGSKKLVL